MHEAAERILFSTRLEEKLALPPIGLSDDRPGPALVLTSHDAPGRPRELRMGPRGVKADFPGETRIRDERERGRMLHFLANHELLAAELMALALLKFPDAPAEYRAGVYAAMREEQMHTRMYLRRMRECGVEFGDLPLNDFFWKLVSPASSPLDFVTRLNLTFEQANLDFSKHYAALFREAGDPGTAAVLEKIYQDEIGHVGHGVKWFRHWKRSDEADWDVFQRIQAPPLTLARAKGAAPFNVEGRRLAGLDEDFIRRLELHGESRGRTPVVAWFNPDAENRVMAQVSSQAHYTPNKFAVALDEDLEILSFAWCRPDDVALLRRRPSDAHLHRLKRAGLDIPEIVELRDMPSLQERKLGGLSPWAWSPDASALLAPLAERISPKLPRQWSPGLPPLFFSKEIGLRLESALACPGGGLGTLCCTVREAQAVMEKLLATMDAVLFKAVHACAGRGHLRIDRRSTPEATRLWLEQAIAKHRAVVVEPWLDRVLDFSALYDVSPAGARLAGMTVMENDSTGRFTGTRVAHKWGSALPEDVAAFLFKDAKVMSWYGDRISSALPSVLPGYTGPAGIDAMVYRQADGRLALKTVVELNVRMTMGRVALELQQRLGPGAMRILRRRGDFPAYGAALPLNDPTEAKEFLAVWAAD